MRTATRASKTLQIQLEPDGLRCTPGNQAVQFALTEQHARGLAVTGIAPGGRTPAHTEVTVTASP